MRTLLLALAALVVPASSDGDAPPFDVALRGGTIYDGSGGAPYVGDVGIRGDRIVAAGPAGEAGVGPAKLEIDARGLAVAPGFVNMLSWSTESLLVDGRSLSELRQGVTLEVMGEGESMGPLDDAMKREMVEQQGDLKFDVTWTTLGQYLDGLEKKGVACNVASLVGAATVRVHELGHADRAPTSDELARMQQLVRDAMEEGALGVGSALIYVPGSYATTDELVALCQAAAPYGGRYVSHLRSEGNRWLEAIDELVEIARRAKVGAEIWHFKAAGERNWGKVDGAVARIEAARRAGLDVTADLYTYVAGATGFDAAMPPWVQEGGYPAWAQRLKDPAVRARVAAEMTTPTDAWESLYRAAGGPDRVICAGFKNEALKPLTGKTLAEIAALRGKSPEETAMDLVVEDGTRVSVIYFLMSEENVRREIGLPWMAFCSDEKSMAPEGDFLKSNCHPRAYGNFARLLGKYVRDEKAAPLADVIRRLTSFPCDNLRIAERGRLAPGKFADVVLFDPATVADHATFERPHALSTGVKHVFVNGVQVLRDGASTGAMPGRFVRGPGFKPARQAGASEERTFEGRTYRFHAGKDAKKPSPLVLAFHGLGSNGLQTEVMTGLDAVADAHGFAVAYPDGENKMWRYQEKSPDVEFTGRLIDALAKSGEADPARVYATGLSNGAYFCNRLALDLSDKLAAIAPVAGTLPKIMAERAKPPRPMPVISFHGTDDRIVGYDGTDAFSKQQASLGADELARFWAKSNGAVKEPEVEKLPDAAEDGATVERLTWKSDSAPVVHYKVVGGGHTWPGSQLDLERMLGRTTKDIDASEEIWKFFARFHLPDAPPRSAK